MILSTVKESIDKLKENIKERKTIVHNYNVKLTQVAFQEAKNLINSLTEKIPSLLDKENNQVKGIKYLNSIKEENYKNSIKLEQLIIENNELYVIM